MAAASRETLPVNVYFPPLSQPLHELVVAMNSTFGSIFRFPLLWDVDTTWIPEVQVVTIKYLLCSYGIIL